MPELWYGHHSSPDTYRYIRDLGNGAEGTVVEAEERHGDDGTTIRVAVKVMPPTGDSTSALAWVAQVRLLLNLKHRSLARVQEVFLGPEPHLAGAFTDANTTPSKQDHGRQWRYMVMEMVGGRGLLEWLDHQTRQDSELTLSERLQPLRAIAAALDDLHDGSALGHPMVHGDVKPGNIIVNQEGRSTLVDFGLTQLVNRSGNGGYTSPYAAPELLVPNATCTPASDRFAFAATVAHVALGHTPPSGSRGPETDAIEARLRNAPEVGRYRDFVAALLTALRATPDQRPPVLRNWLAELTSLSLISIPPRIPPMPRETRNEVPEKDGFREHLGNPALLVVGALSGVSSAGILALLGKEFDLASTVLIGGGMVAGYLGAVTTATSAHRPTSHSPENS